MQDPELDYKLRRSCKRMIKVCLSICLSVCVSVSLYRAAISIWAAILSKYVPSNS